MNMNCSSRCQKPNRRSRGTGNRPAAALALRAAAGVGGEEIEESRTLEQGFMKTGTSSKGGRESRLKTFALSAPNARHVELVGDFTRWTEQPIALHKTIAGVWETTVNLRRGIHLYRFLVDGQWQDDPKSTLQVRNPFGTRDSVTHIE